MEFKVNNNHRINHVHQTSNFPSMKQQRSKPMLNNNNPLLWGEVTTTTTTTTSKTILTKQ